MKVIYSGWNNREFMIAYEKYIYDKLGFGEPDILNCEEFLGRNFSFFIFEKENKNYMVLLDADDGSGIALDNCKLFEDERLMLMEKYNVVDYIIFKMQYSSKSPHNDCYPYSHKTYPLGYFPYFPNHIAEFKKSWNIFTPQDIDFLWIGTVNYEDNPPIWPKGLDKKHWQLGQRIKGFETIKSIKEKRPEWNIVVSSNTTTYFDYLALVMRSKVCLELPGVGNLTTRFFENLQLDKCILGKKIYLELPYEIVPDKHYASIDDWGQLEHKMDELINDQGKRFDIIRNVRKLQPKLTYEYAFKQMINTIENWLTKL